MFFPFKLFDWKFHYLLNEKIIYLFNLFCSVIFFCNSFSNFRNIDLVILFYSGIKKIKKFIQ